MSKIKITKKYFRIMSGIFHKSCYTSRSSGYKYRTLSTNTGERRYRNKLQDNAFDKKFKELRKAIIIRVNKEVNETHKARQRILEKFSKLDAKINSMLELQDTVTALRSDLNAVACTLGDMVNKVDRIENASNSLQSQKPSFRSQSPIKEEEDRDSIVTRFEL